MTSGKYDIEKELRNWFSGANSVVIAGIGNPIRMDDQVGVNIVQGLKNKASEKVFLIECETVPESFLQQITDFNPTHVLLIDAAILGLRAGESRLFDPEQLTVFPAISTHMLPLRIFCDYVKTATKASLALLLIQPKQTDFGEKLTAEIRASAKKMVRLLMSILPK